MTAFSDTDRGLGARSDRASEVRVDGQAGRTGRRDRRWRYRPRLTLRILLVAVLAAVALLPLILFWVWSQSVAFQRQIDDVTDRHLLIARNLGAALTRYQRDVASAFIALSDDTPGAPALIGADELMGNLGIRCISVIGPDGGVALQQQADGEDCGRMIGTDSRATLDTLLEGDGPVFTDVMADMQGRPAIHLLLRRGDDLVVGTLSTQYFVELGQSISFGHRGHAAIVDGAGRVLSHPLAEWQQSMRDVSRVPPVARMMAGETGISEFYSPALEDDMIAGFTVVPETGWGVMIPQPLGELRDAASAANRSAMLILAASLIVAAAIGWLLAVRLTAPLKSVIGAAQRMAQGDVTARVRRREGPLTTREFSELQRSFNGMARAVQRAEKRERAAREIAVSANHAKSMFLANTSHELRTPLNAIIGFSDVMVKEIFGPIGQPKYRDYASDIQHSAEHLRRLISDLLDITSFDLGKIALSETQTAIGSILHDVEAMTRQSASAKDLELRFTLEGGFQVRADHARLSQVLINLIANAIRFTPAGGRIVVDARLAEDGRAALSVTDNGPGIAPHELANVLEPFQRGEMAATRSSDGVGLGLAIVGAIARAHGAEFTLHSALGEGTRAVVILPADRVGSKESASVA